MLLSSLVGFFDGEVLQLFVVVGLHFPVHVVTTDMLSCWCDAPTPVQLFPFGLLSCFSAGHTTWMQESIPGSGTHADLRRFWCTSRVWSRVEAPFEVLMHRIWEICVQGYSRDLETTAV